jgi:hypothetical protein
VGMCRMSIAQEGHQRTAVLGELLTVWSAKDHRR